jgi:hypothetical protein
MKRLSLLAFALALTACADLPFQPAPDAGPSAAARSASPTSGPPIHFTGAACTVQANLTLSCDSILACAGERSVNFYVRGEWGFEYECRNKSGKPSRKDSGTLHAFGLRFDAGQTGDPLTRTGMVVAMPTPRPSCPKSFPNVVILDSYYTGYWEIEARASDGTAACVQSDDRHGCAS